MLLSSIKCCFFVAGSPAYDSVRPLSYQEADVFLLCYKISDPISLYNVKNKWIRELRQHRPDVPVILCGCQSDLRQVCNLDEIWHFLYPLFCFSVTFFIFLLFLSPFTSLTFEFVLYSIFFHFFVLYKKFCFQLVLLPTFIFPLTSLSRGEITICSEEFEQDYENGCTYCIENLQ